MVLWAERRERDLRNILLETDSPKRCPYDNNMIDPYKDCARENKNRDNNIFLDILLTALYIIHIKQSVGIQ